MSAHDREEPTPAERAASERAQAVLNQIEQQDLELERFRACALGPVETGAKPLPRSDEVLRRLDELRGLLGMKAQVERYLRDGETKPGQGLLALADVTSRTLRAARELQRELTGREILN